MTDGDLFKESKTKMKMFKGQYRQIFLAIDFKRQLIRFKTMREDVQFNQKKDIAFQDVIEVKRQDIDVYKGEHKIAVGPPFQFKFSLRTMTSQLFLFANSEIERELWMESFFKIKEINESSNVNFSLKNNVLGYQREINATRGSSNNNENDGIAYKTESLLVNKTGIKGTVMKAIQNISLFHDDMYHKRFFVLEFGQPYCYIYKSEKDTKSHQCHKQVSIISASVIQDDEIQANLEEREQKRSRSFLRRKMQNEVKQCQWNFPFKLTFTSEEP